MQKTAIIKNIDGHQIIHGFSTPATDPEATKIAAQAAADGNDSVVNLRQRIIEFSTQIKFCRLDMAALNGEGHKVKASNLPDKDKLLKRLEAKYFTKEEKLEEYTQELINKNKELQPIIKQILIENTKYFEASTSDTAITDEQFNDLSPKLKGIKAGEKLSLDGTIVVDKRDLKYAVENGGVWSLGKIKKLGDDLPTAAKPLSELTAQEIEQIKDQKETNRIGKLSQTEKTAELQNNIEALANKAAIMKARLELKEDSDPLAKAKAWFASEKTALEAKYA